MDETRSAEPANPNDPPPNGGELSDGELAASLRAEREDLRDQLRDAGPVLLAGIIPLGLVMLLLSVLLGDWVWVLMPAGLFALFYGVPIQRAWRQRIDSPLPLVTPGHGRFSGGAKWRLATGGALLLVAVVIVQATQPQWMGALRELVMGWRLP